MTRASAHSQGGYQKVPARLSAITNQMAVEVHQLYLATRPDSRVDDLYRETFDELRERFKAEAIAAGIDPTTIPPHPRSKAARLLREANAAANDPTRKAMPKGKIRPKRSPIRE